MRKLIVIAALLVVACGCKVIETPGGYLRIENTGGYLFKAVSPDGCAFTLSEEQNEGVSSLDNWKKAAKNHLTRAKGYECVSEDKLKSAKGSPGWEMVFSASYHGLDYLYYLAVVRRDSSFWGIHKLYIMEAAGEKAYMEEDIPRIKKAARTLRY
jgi:hypothetical protein